MSADRELLELAAKVVELHGFWVDAGLNVGSDAAPKIWNPLTDDGDALRLAAKLKLNVMQGDFSVGVTDEAEIDDVSFVPDESQRLYAIRESIVRAAAEIAKAMPLTEKPSSKWRVNTAQADTSANPKAMTKETS